MYPKQEHSPYTTTNPLKRYTVPSTFQSSDNIISPSKQTKLSEIQGTHAFFPHKSQRFNDVVYSESTSNHVTSECYRGSTGERQNQIDIKMMKDIKNRDGPITTPQNSFYERYYQLNHNSNRAENRGTANAVNKDNHFDCNPNSVSDKQKNSLNGMHISEEKAQKVR